MSADQTWQNAAPVRGSTRLDSEAGHAATAELLAFAENLVREANGGSANVLGASLHVLGRGASNRVIGEALCLGRSNNSIWRVTVSDDTGMPLAELTFTLETPGAAPAEIVAISPRRSSDADDRRTRIALAARDVFADKGYTAATMRDIAAAAEMHVPTMYQYVRSKDEILELVYSWTINHAIEGMEEVLGAAGSADELIDRIVARLHEVNEEMRRGTLVMNRETRSLSRAARDRVLGRYSQMVRRIGEVIAQGQKQGVFRPMDPQLAAVFIDALADVWVLRPFAVGHADESAYTDELMAFVRGALTSATATDSTSPESTTSNRRE